MATTQPSNPALTAFFMELAKNAPELFKLLVVMAVKYYDGLTGPKPVTPTAPSVDGTLDLTGDTGTGEYHLVSKPVPESLRQSIRENFARGIIYEEAAEWIGGFIAGVAIKGAAIL